MSVAKNTIRLINSLLLLPCLFLFLTSHVPAYVQEIGRSHKAVLFTPAITGCPVSVFTVDRRTNSNSFDGLVKYVLISGKICSDFNRAYSYLLSEYFAGFTHCADRAAISIRAPPFF
jgi:hypothetical protein